MGRLNDFLLAIAHSGGKDGGNGRIETHLATRLGVDEPQPTGVQHEALRGISLGAILRVASYGVTEGFHLRADLILAASLERELYQGAVARGLEDTIVRDGLLAMQGIGAIDLHATVFSEEVPQRVLRWLWHTLDNGHV